MIESNKLYTDIYAFSQEIIAENVRSSICARYGPYVVPIEQNGSPMMADTAFAGKAIIAIQELNIQIDVYGAISDKLQQAQSYTNQLCDALGQCSMTQQKGVWQKTVPNRHLLTQLPQITCIISWVCYKFHRNYTNPEECHQIFVV